MGKKQLDFLKLKLGEIRVINNDIVNFSDQKKDSERKLRASKKKLQDEFGNFDSDDIIGMNAIEFSLNKMKKVELQNLLDSHGMDSKGNKPILIRRLVESSILSEKFSNDVKQLEKNLKDNKQKKVAMFCTGGIRCEIASSYLMSKGFDEVYQLEGGVLKYLESVKVEDQLWEGECFVFDERVSVNKALEEGNFIQCFGCRRPLTQDEVNSKYYKKGVSCRFCYKESSESDKERFAQRQKQIELADQRGHKHMGVTAKQTK